MPFTRQQAQSGEPSPSPEDTSNTEGPVTYAQLRDLFVEQRQGFESTMAAMVQAQVQPVTSAQEDLRQRIIALEERRDSENRTDSATFFCEEQKCCLFWLASFVFRFLKKHQDVILAGKEDAQVFVPLCGKAVELKWFYDKGHRVVGVEVVEAPVREFFDENALPCEESFCPVLNRKILQTPDKRLRIFICNIFDFNT
ncbi:thiopurine S-methyltransferase [Ixodes scapularis]